MPACPAGHESSASDFCDVCGMRIGAPAGSPAGDRPAVRRPVRCGFRVRPGRGGRGGRA